MFEEERNTQDLSQRQVPDKFYDTKLLYDSNTRCSCRYRDLVS
jgi:hypothetical protein